MFRAEVSRPSRRDKSINSVVGSVAIWPAGPMLRCSRTILVLLAAFSLSWWMPQVPPFLARAVPCVGVLRSRVFLRLPFFSLRRRSCVWPQRSMLGVCNQDNPARPWIRARGGAARQGGVDPGAARGDSGDADTDRGGAYASRHGAHVQPISRRSLAMLRRAGGVGSHDGGGTADEKEGTRDGPPWFLTREMTAAEPRMAGAA